MSVRTLLEEIEQFLDQASHTTIRECRRTMQSGITAFPPQVGTHYEAFWLRDYAYMIEGNPEAFTETESVDACTVFIDSMREDGACVDCVGFDGTPIYMPGYGSMGDNPVADGSQFTIDVAWHTWKKNNNPDFVALILPSLQRAISAMPISLESGLIHINPGLSRERCPYGFTDTVLKEGDVLFSSLLAAQAHSQLADLMEVVGDSGREQREKAALISQSINNILWDKEKGLYRAATLQCREHDIWGSAFAVYVGITNVAQANAIASYFAQHHAELTQCGQVRHLPAETSWEATSVVDGSVPPGTYQNGAYWATATGWYCYALSLIDLPLAVKTLKELVNDFRDRRINEWVSDKRVAVPGYVASVCLPLAAARRLLHELS